MSAVVLVLLAAGALLAAYLVGPAAVVARLVTS